MKNFIETLRNIWSIEELRNRILLTLAILFVFRLGSYVVLPGVIPSVLQSVSNQAKSNDLLGLINVFTGGAFNNASIFALGVMPYITASIIVQLLGFAVPYFQRLQQHEGESGRKKLNQITRFLTVAITLVQASGYLTYLKSINAIDTSKISLGMFWLTSTVILATGTVFAMWLGERITDKGIGNGVSLIIMAGIIARLPSAFIYEFQAQNPIVFVFEMAMLFLVVLATVLIIQGVRKIPVQFAKRMVGRSDSSLPNSGNRDYIPIKVNAAGVMPIIFAQALMFLPATLFQFISGEQVTGISASLMRHFNDFTSITYNILYFLLIVVLTYVYTALLVNPKNYADYLKRSNAFIPGVKPGENTAEYIDAVTTRITLPGAVFLGLIAILPAFAAAFGIN